MKNLILAIALFVSGFSFGQSGYLGSLNSIELNIKAGPSLKRTNVFKPGSNEAKKRLRVANMQYNISYGRIFSKVVEVKVGYSFSRMLLYTGRNTFSVSDTIPTTWGYDLTNKPLNWLQDPSVMMHAGNLEFKYYRQGSMAPTGKFYGLGFQFGGASIDQSYEHLVGKRDVPTKESGFSKKYPILESQTEIFDRGQSTRFFYIYGTLGRNYPLTKELLLSVSTTFPLITMYMSPTGLDYGFDVGPTSIGYENDDSIDEILNYSIKQYRRISVDVGIKYHF